MKEAITFTIIAPLIFVVIIGIIMWPLPGFIVLVALLVLLGFYDLFQKKHDTQKLSCNSARGMMLALGCVQSLKCNTNECPTGVTTNNPKFVRGLVVSEKWQRVRNYHKNMLEDFLELLAASGCSSLEEMNRSLIYKKVDKQWLSYAEVIKAQRFL